METPVQFFREHAGWSYDPAKETAAQGRYKCARRLAAAERKAHACGYSWQWEIDRDMDSSDWSDERPAWSTWNCTMYDPDGVAQAHLCGVDFGRDGEPWGDPYRRVVEAELASECF